MKISDFNAPAVLILLSYDCRNPQPSGGRATTSQSSSWVDRDAGTMRKVGLLIEVR